MSDVKLNQSACWNHRWQHAIDSASRIYIPIIEISQYNANEEINMHLSHAVDWSQAWLIEVNFTSLLEWHHTHYYKKIHPTFYFPPFVYMTLTFGSANGIEYFQETYNTLILESFNRHKINIRVNSCFRLIETFLTFCLNSCLSSDLSHSNWNSPL